MAFLQNLTNKIYVANEGSNNVTVIDGATNATSSVAGGGPSPQLPGDEQCAFALGFRNGRRRWGRAGTQIDSSSNNGTARAVPPGHIFWKTETDYGILISVLLGGQMRNGWSSIASALLAAGFSSASLSYGAALPNLLSINPSVVQFSPSGVGSTVSGYYDVYVDNPGPAAVTITGFSITGPHASDFSISTNSCPTSPTALIPGTNCYLYLTFTPSAVGTREANLVVNDVGGAPQPVLLVGEGLAATKTLVFSPPLLSFPALPLGLPPQNAANGYVNIGNTGTVPLNIQSINVTGANAADYSISYNTCIYGPIPPNSTCYVTVAFLPKSIGNRQASLTVVDDAAGSPQVMVMTGAGTPAVTALELFPAAIAFAPTGSANTESTQVTVTNSGSEPVTIDNFGLTGPNAADFSLTSNSCLPAPYTLPAQNSCFFNMQFRPGAPGIRLATLEIVDSAPGSPQAIPIEGTGASSSVLLSFNPSPYSFGSYSLGLPTYGTVSLENLGSGAADISLQITGIDAQDFTLPSQCGYLGPNSSCYLSVLFTPSVAGARTATLVATDTNSGQSQSTVMTGTGLPAGALVFATGVVFPAELVGSTGQGSLYLYLQGAGPVTITSFSITGPGNSDFGILQNGCSPAIQYSCNIQLTFTPSATGTREAEMRIVYNGPGSPLIVPLAAIGLTPAWNLSFSPAALDYSPTPVGQSIGNGQVTISNVGSEGISLGRFSIAGADAQDYSITENYCPQAPATLAPYTGCQITIVFTPSATGARLARLQVADNAVGNPQSLSLVGFGITSLPALSVNPNALQFPSLPLGSSSQQGIYLSALSTPVSLKDLKVVGSNAGDFTLLNNCPPQITNCDVYITFTPSVSGIRLADLVIQDNASGSPQVVPLSGMGVTPAPPILSVALSPIPLVFTQIEGVGYTLFASLNVTNTGSGNVSLTGFHITGRNKGDFGIQSNDCPLNSAPLAPNNYCSISVAFTPSAPGIRIATFSVTDNATGSPQSIGMVGEALPAAKTLVVAPLSILFSPTPVGSTDYNGGTVNITNSGSVPVNFKSFGIAGTNAADFTISSNYCANSQGLAPGSSCQVYISFTPSATGTRSAVLNIGSDATGSPQPVSLTGTGQ